MCENYKRAAENRDMVRLKLNIEGYLFIEQLVRNWPRKKLLPEQLLGRLPMIGGREASEHGFHEIDNTEFRYSKPDGGFAIPFYDRNGKFDNDNG